MADCTLCGLVYCNNYPEVELFSCTCKMCIYCAFACLCLKRCVRCQQQNCFYFKMEANLSPQEIENRKMEFIRDYLRNSTINPAAFPTPLNLPEN